MSHSADGKVTTMTTESTKYLEAAVKKFMQEVGVLSLPYVQTPSTDDRFDEKSQQKGEQAATAASHLMSIMYIARLCRADLLVTVSFLARRNSKWTVNEDRRLKRLMQHIHYHLDLAAYALPEY